MALRKLTLLSRPGCHLCDQVRDALDKLVVRYAEVLVEEIDIDQNEDLRAKYTDAVPVVLVDGKELVRGRIDPDALAKVFYDDFSQNLIGF